MVIYQEKGFVGTAGLVSILQAPRNGANHIHRAVNCREIGAENGIIHLRLTKEEALK